MFKESEVTDEDPQRPGESDLDWFKRCSRPECVGGRRLIEEWIQYAPSVLAGEWRTRILSDDHFYSAFYELMVWRALDSSGIRTSAAPTSPGGSVPDLWCEVGGAQFLVECKVISDHDRGKRLRDLFARAERYIHPTEFRLYVRELREAKQECRPRAFAAEVNRVLKLLPVDECRHQGGTSFDEYPQLQIEVDGWSVTCAAIFDANGSKSSKVWAGGPTFCEWDNSATLKEVVRKKARQHASAADTPILVCISDRRRVSLRSDMLVLESVLGTSYVTYDLNDCAQTREGRKRNGVFSEASKASSERIAGVLACGPVSPWAVNSIDATLWLNPRCEKVARGLLETWSGRVVTWDLTSGDLIDRAGVLKI